MELVKSPHKLHLGSYDLILNKMLCSAAYILVTIRQ